MDAVNIIIIIPSMIFGILIISSCISCYNNCYIHSIENIDERLERLENGESAESAETPRPVINVD